MFLIKDLFRHFLDVLGTTKSDREAIILRCPEGKTIYFKQTIGPHATRWLCRPVLDRLAKIILLPKNFKPYPMDE